MEHPHHEEKSVAGFDLGREPTLRIESPAFEDGQPIPRAHAGAHGRSPALKWSPPPPGTRELVLLCEDPDAPRAQPFVHWIVVGLPADTLELPEGLPPTPLSSGAVQGKSDMGRDGYYGPEPPPGHGVHHYHFQLFAVDHPVHARDRDSLVRAMRGHVVAWGELVGTYQR